MLRRALVILAALQATSSQGSDLRGVSHGAPCDEIARVELAQEAEPLRDVEEMGNFLNFRVEHDGRRGFATYSCVDGWVFKQIVSFRIASSDEAEEVFQGQLRSLNGRFGQPCNDWRRVPFWERVYLWFLDIYDPDLFNRVDWDLGNSTQADLSLIPPTKHQEYWTVALGISGPPVVIRRDSDGTEYPIDTSLECRYAD